MARPDDPKPPQPDHSMKEDQPLGWDTAPEDLPEGEERHPRQKGKGGTPDHELPLDEAQWETDSNDNEKPGESD